MAEWTTREERRAIARAEYDHIMRSASPDPAGAYLESGVIGYVFGEMWRRGVLTARDRRWITLTCVGAAGAITPIETHVYAALKSGDISYSEFDEFVLHFGTQAGWPKASAMQMYGMMAIFKISEETGEPMRPNDFELWAEPVDDGVRRERGVAAYEADSRRATAHRRDRIPRPRPSRLPLRRDMDPAEIPHPPRPAHHQHLRRGGSHD